MIWTIVRWVLIAANAAILAMFAYGFLSGGKDTNPVWLDAVLVGGFGLNFLYLVFGRREIHMPSRLSRLASLWLDAKEVELRKRAGK